MPCSASPEEEVAGAASRRAEALSAGDEAALRLTQTWVRTPEGWRCLAGHASLPAG
jgi:hypothetical protein